MGQVAPGGAHARLARLLDRLDEVRDEREQRDEEEDRVKSAAGADQHPDDGEDRSDRARGGDPLAEDLLRAAPVEERHHAEERREEDADRERDAVVERRAHLRGLRREPGEQRRRGAEQHHSRGREQRRDREHEEDGPREERLVARLRRDLAPAPDEAGEPRHEEEEEVPHQPAGDAEVHEGMHGEVGEDAGPGQEGRVHDQHVGQDREREVELSEASAGALQQHAVHQRRRCEPRHERGVLDRVPTPVAAPAQGHVGPVSAEQDRASERDDGEQRPREGGAHPLVVPTPPQRGDRERERHRGRGVAEEHDGRVDRHPRVLQQGVEPLAVERHLSQRQPVEETERRLLQQDEEQGDEGGVVDDERAVLVVPRVADQGQPDDHPGEEPEQEAALLTRPEGGEQVPERERSVGVREHVVDAEVVSRDEVQEHRARRDDGERRQRVELPRLAAGGLVPTQTQDVVDGRSTERGERYPQRDDARNEHLSPQLLRRRRARAARHEERDVYSFSSTPWYFDGHFTSSFSASSTPSR